MTETDSFKIAMKQTREAEGGYCNVDGDKGGETYIGIARNFWSNWQGWKIIDTTPKSTWKSNNTLQSLVDKFYYDNFWVKIGADKIEASIAQEIMNDCINAGIKGGIKTAQQILGLPITGKLTQALIDSLNSLN